MEFLSVRATAERWGVSVRNVQRLLKEDRIHGAYKCSGCWMIPIDAPKPDDPRRERKKALEPKPETVPETAEKAPAPPVRPNRLAYGLLSVIIPMPRRNPDAVPPMLKETALRREYEVELAYMRGNYELASRRFSETLPDDPTRFCACMLSLLSAIHLNDSELYGRVSHYLRQERRSSDPNVAHMAEVAMTGPSLSMRDMNQVPLWVQKGDFSGLLPEARPMGMYLSLKNLQGQKRYGELLCACKAAIALWEREDTFTLLDIYLRMLCATGCYELNRVEECDRHLLAAMELALPNGFITPFVEFWMNTGCQIEHLLEQYYPQWRDPVERVNAATWKNWIAFHNHYTRENITTLLTQREYRLARIILAGGTYQNVADELYLSVSTVKSMLSAIYDKLMIHSRAELAEMIM